jgi:pimeloyl-ACP methyl ester carboxylesterase
MVRRLLVVLSVVACGDPKPPIIEPTAPREPLPALPPVPVVAWPEVPADERIEITEAYAPTSFVDQVDGRGRPILLIPGIGCPGTVWDDTVAHFAGAAETHVLTLAGFAGQAPISGPINATARDEIARYIRDRKLDHPVVIGHSMGGFLALWLAVAEPDLVGPVVVVDAAPQIDGEPRPEAVARASAETWRLASDAEFAQRTRDMFTRMANNRARIAPLLDLVARSDKRAFADALVEMATVDIRPQLAAIKAPVLFVLADTPPYPELVARQTQPIARRELVVLPKTQHFVFFDDPDGFYRVVDRFLATNPPAKLDARTDVHAEMVSARREARVGQWTKPDVP